MLSITRRYLKSKKFPIGFAKQFHKSTSTSIPRLATATISSMSKYELHYDESLKHPEAFWANAANDVHWFKKYDKVFESKNASFYSWFVGGEMNSCYNAVDYHVEAGRGEQIAIQYDSPVTNSKRSISFSELQTEVSKFAGVLSSKGVEKGDRVVIYMPMVPEAVVAMLACARIGAVHCVVFGGFSSRELSKRINDTKAKVIVSATCGLHVDKEIEYKPLVDGALALSSHKQIEHIIFERPECRIQLKAGESYWNDLMENAKPHDCVPVKSTDPLYILHTSGTTSNTKGILRDNGGHNVMLKWSMRNVFGASPGEVFWAASDIGWVVGHSYSVYGPLFHGCTSILYEGSPIRTPDAGAFWRINSEYNVSTMIASPTALRAVRREDPNLDLMNSYNMPKLRSLFLVGERADPGTVEFFNSKLKIPIVDNWWQTETGAPICASCIGLGEELIKFGSVSRPVPGYDVRVLSNDGDAVGMNITGNLVLKLPLPPGAFPTLYNNDDLYVESYLMRFPGYYDTGDAGHADEDNYIYVMSRTDDIINVSGRRLCTGAMEEAILNHPHVAECAVIGAEDPIKGNIPIGIIVLQSGVDCDKDQIVQEVIQLVREGVGAVAFFKQAIIVKQLPKTRSGKVLRNLMKCIADDTPYSVPGDIIDESTISGIKDGLSTIGYPIQYF